MSDFLFNQAKGRLAMYARLWMSTATVSFSMTMSAGDPWNLGGGQVQIPGHQEDEVVADIHLGVTFKDGRFELIARDPWNNDRHLHVDNQLEVLEWFQEILEKRYGEG